MTFIATFVLLMKAGALAKASNLGGRLIDDSYNGVKRVLENVYHITALKFLEQKPDDPKALEKFEQELEGQSLEANKDLIQLTNRLAEGLERLSAGELSQCGLTVSEIKTKRNFLMERVTVEGSVEIRSIAAEGDFTVRDLSLKKN